MSHTCIVIGHGGGRNIHRSIRDVIHPIFNEIIAVTPRDDQLRLYPTEYCMGQSDYNGHGTKDRSLFALTLAASQPSDYVTLLEYDAIAWPRYVELAKPEYGQIACGQVFHDGSGSFTGRKFTHWPVTATPKTWALVSIAARYVEEGGFPDRLVAAGVQMAGFEFVQVTYSTFSANKIDASNIKDAKIAIQLGACCIHGIKDQSTFEDLNNAYNQANNVSTGP